MWARGKDNQNNKKNNKIAKERNHNNSKNCKNNKNNYSKSENSNKNKTNNSSNTGIALSSTQDLIVVLGRPVCRPYRYSTQEALSHVTPRSVVKCYPTNLYPIAV